MRHRKIGTAAFSPDGNSLVVARYDARDARTPNKGYLANVSRTVSILGVENGATRCIVEKKVRLGNCGPAFSSFKRVQKVAEFYGNDFVVLLEFGGGDVNLHSLSDQSSLERLAEEAGGFALSRDQHLLASSFHTGVTVWTLPQGERQSTWQVGHLSFRLAPTVSISDDNAFLATASNAGAVVRELATGHTVRRIAITNPLDVAFVPGTRQLAIASTKSVRVANFERQHDLRTLCPGSWRCCMSVSPNGALIAVAHATSGVRLCEIATGKSANCPTSRRVTALSFSRDGKLLAVGDDAGRISLVDTSTRETIWSVRPPGRDRPPWTFPVTMFAIWLWGCSRMRRQEL